MPPAESLQEKFFDGTLCVEETSPCQGHSAVQQLLNPLCFSHTYQNVPKQTDFIANLSC